ncbi:Alpha/Beta hydrolase protein [Mycena galopus ATCC 62051]|nr:Alpha/Beta hydrolase protein [Mycena galopus ATCC 62051]
MRYCTGNLSTSQLQYAFGTTLSVYEKWTKQVKLTPVVEEIGDDARLLWIGPKRTDRVLLFCHGGCFFLPSTDFTFEFWHYVQQELKKKNVDIGIAFVQYSLAPFAKFPTPLKQVSRGVEHLFAAGVRPENLYISGDSAGGNLALQIVSQMLHPRPGIPAIRPAAPLGGIFLSSPWASLTADTKSMTEFDGIDFMSKAVVEDLGRQILNGVPAADNAFAEPAKAPDSWFNGVDAVVGRVLIAVGGSEIMRDDILQVGERLKQHHRDVQVGIQDGGVHDDMLLDFMTKETKLGSLTSMLIDWLAESST